MNLEAYYAQLPREGGFVSKCRMALTDTSLEGKRVLDVGCRRGKGVFKLSDRVGAAGHVTGVDWRPEFLEEAREGAARALERSGLTESNMDFRAAFPEDLRATGIEDGSYDVVYVNNGITLFADPARAVREFARALVPGGMLILETVVRNDGEEDEPALTAADIEAARAAGNSVEAARTITETLAWLEAAGFGEPTVAESFPVAPDGRQMPEGEATGSPLFMVKVLHTRKR